MSKIAQTDDDAIMANLGKAFATAMRIRPKVGGFPYLAAVLHKSGVQRNHWTLPGCSSLYVTTLGNVTKPMPPVVTKHMEPQPFDRDGVVAAIRADQAGLTEFPEFLTGIWEAGVVEYDVDFNKRVCVYYGVNKADFYEEEYPEVQLPEL